MIDIDFCARNRGIAYVCCLCVGFHPTWRCVHCLNSRCCHFCPGCRCWPLPSPAMAPTAGAGACAWVPGYEGRDRSDLVREMGWQDNKRKRETTRECRHNERYVSWRNTATGAHYPQLASTLTMELFFIMEFNRDLSSDANGSQHSTSSRHL